MIYLYAFQKKQRFQLLVPTNHLLLYIEFEFVEGVLGPNNPGLCRPGTIRVASTEGGVTSSRLAKKPKSSVGIFLFHNSNQKDLRCHVAQDPVN
jgi:hypothetical protein